MHFLFFQFSATLYLEIAGHRVKRNKTWAWGGGGTWCIEEILTVKCFKSLRVHAVFISEFRKHSVSKMADRRPNPTSIWASGVISIYN